MRNNRSKENKTGELWAWEAGELRWRERGQDLEGSCPVRELGLSLLGRQRPLQGFRQGWGKVSFAFNLPPLLIFSS